MNTRISKGAQAALEKVMNSLGHEMILGKCSKCNICVIPFISNADLSCEEWIIKGIIE